jgi:hypothetical protein
MGQHDKRSSCRSAFLLVKMQSCISRNIPLSLAGMSQTMLRQRRTKEYGHMPQSHAAYARIGP